MDSKKSKIVNAPESPTPSGELDYPSELSGYLHSYHNRILLDDAVTDINAILLTVYIKEWRSKEVGVDASIAKDMFASFGRKTDPNFRVNLGNAVKKGLIESKGETLSLSMKGLNEIRRMLGKIQKGSVYVIKSGQNFTAVRLLEEFLDQEISESELDICDSYVSASTLFPLSRLNGRLKVIKLLTFNINDKMKFNEYKSKLEKESGAKIDVRLSRRIHDRYLLNGSKCWFLGASIKDVGNKDTIIKEISEMTATVRDMFMERWLEAESLE